MIPSWKAITMYDVYMHGCMHAWMYVCIWEVIAVRTMQERPTRWLPPISATRVHFECPEAKEVADQAMKQANALHDRQASAGAWSVIQGPQ